MPTEIEITPKCNQRKLKGEIDLEILAKITKSLEDAKSGRIEEIFPKKKAR